MAAPVNLIAIPVIASLAAGGGALVNYASGSPAPVEIAKEIARPADLPCDAQTWPYLDARCLSHASQRPVRLVMAPRSETTDAADDASPAAIQSRAAAAPDRATLPPALTSGSAVLYQPQTSVPAAKPHRKRPERTSRHSARLYQVPSESRSGSGALIVVRPLRLDAFR